MYVYTYIYMYTYIYTHVYIIIWVHICMNLRCIYVDICRYICSCPDSTIHWHVSINSKVYRMYTNIFVTVCAAQSNVSVLSGLKDLKMRA